MRSTALASLALFAAAACSPLQDTKAVDAEIAAFHQKLNAQDFGGIYAASSPELQSLTTQDGLTQLLTTIHGKLGNFRSGKDVGWKDNVDTSGHFLTINYSAQFDHGEASEDFIYRIDGAQARLAGYHVKSNAPAGG